MTTDTSSNPPPSFEALRGPCFDDPTSTGSWWHESERKLLVDIYESSKSRRRTDCDNNTVEHNSSSAAAKDSSSDEQQDLPLKKKVVLLQGPVGCGKRTLLQALQLSVEDQGGLFLRIQPTKSWGYQHPHEAMLHGLVNFVGNILDDTTNANKHNKGLMLKRIRARASVPGGLGQMLQDLMRRLPIVSDLFGVSPPGNTTFNNNGETIRSQLDNLTPYFRYSFLDFLGIVSDPVNPFVLTIENLQWASEAALDVVHAILRDSAHQGIFVVLLYTEDGTESFASQVQLMENQWSCFDVEIHKMVLETIQDEQSLQQHFRRILGPIAGLESLADLAYETCGNGGDLLSIDQMLCWIRKNGSLSEHPETKAWVFREDNYSYKSVKDAISSTIHSLSPDCEELFQFIVCLGPRATTEMVGGLGQADKVDLILQKMTSAGLLAQDDAKDIVYFVHDFVHDLFYRAKSSEERTNLHYRLARRLWSTLDYDNMNDRLVFALVDHLRVGRQHIKSSRERLAIARLCLNAAQLSVKQSVYTMASNYLEFGLTMFGERRWHDDYDLCLEMYSASTEIALCTSTFRAVDILVDEVIDNARCYADTLQARSAKVYMMGASGQATEAVQYGHEVLSKLGVAFPTHPAPFWTYQVIHKTNALLRGKSDEQILRLPPMKDHEKLNALKILTILFSFAFSVDPFMSPFLAHEIIRLTLLHGVCAISSMGFVLHGAILSRLPGGAVEGYRYGRLALAIQSHYHVDIWCGRVNAIFYGGVYAFKFPLQGALREIEFAGRRCLLVGDKEFGMRCANVYITCQIDITPIPELTKIIRRFRYDMHFYGDEHNLSLMLPIMYTLLKLSGRTSGDFAILEESRNLAQDVESMDSTGGVYKWACYSLMMVAFMFGEYNDAFAFSKGSKGLLGLAMGAGDASVAFLYDGLTNVVFARQSRGLKRLHHIMVVRERIRSLHHFAVNAPLNFLGKACLLEAELAALRNDHVSAYAKYTIAISLSKENGLFIGAALAQERAGKYFLGRRDDELASKFLSAAIARYGEYGANAKAQHLRQEIVDLGKEHLIKTVQPVSP
ncbi:hypothetical protein ACA910_007758 [Epithemia clementina (nom. ined.)]